MRRPGEFSSRAGGARRFFMMSDVACCLPSIEQKARKACTRLGLANENLA